MGHRSGALSASVMSLHNNWRLSPTRPSPAPTSTVSSRWADHRVVPAGDSPVGEKCASSSLAHPRAPDAAPVPAPVTAAQPMWRRTSHVSRQGWRPVAKRLAPTLEYVITAERERLDADEGEHESRFDLALLVPVTRFFCWFSRGHPRRTQRRRHRQAVRDPFSGRKRGQTHRTKRDSRRSVAKPLRASIRTFSCFGSASVLPGMDSFHRPTWGREWHRYAAASRGRGVERRRSLLIRFRNLQNSSVNGGAEQPRTAMMDESRIRFRQCEACVGIARR